MIRLVAAGLLLGWIPGALALRLPWGDRTSRERLDGDERAFWAVILSGAWSAGAAFTLAVFGRYSLDRLLILTAIAAGLVAVAYRSRLRYRDATSPRVHAVVPLLLFGFALWLYHPAAEYIIGGKDPGVYMNEGVQIAQRGDVITTTSWWRAASGSRGLFFPRTTDARTTATGSWGSSSPIPTNGTGHRPVPAPLSGGDRHRLRPGRADGGAPRLVGLRRDRRRRAVLSWRAAGRPAGGRRRRRAAGRQRRAGLVRGYPNSEIVAQVLMLAGMLALARAYIDGDRFFAPGRGAVARPSRCLRASTACWPWAGARESPTPGSSGAGRAGIAFFGPMIATASGGLAVHCGRILARL